MRRNLLRGAFVAATLWISFTAVSLSQPTELFFSEYIEGSSNNKALEIFNGTGSAINLGTGGYNIQMFFNGNPVASLTINLTGTVANGDVYVVAQSAANATILAQADQTNGSGWFNGDDAVVLRKGTTVVDSIGQAGFDPGTEWGTGVVSTADNTLQRKSSVCAGDAIATDVFDPAVQWNGFAIDTVSNLGTYVGCGSSGISGVGSAQPSVVEPGGTTLLTVTVTPGSTPTSTGITVTGDLSSIGGSATQTFFDNASNGDVMAGDNIFSFQATVAVGTSGGPKTLPVSITDAQARSATAQIELSLPAEIWEIQGSGAASPFATKFVVTRNNVVTALDTNGFFLQTPDARGDASAETSNGIFVFTSSAPTVAIGDQVDVQGTVVEFFDLTEFNNAGLVVSVDSSGNPLPGIQMLGAGTPSATPETPHDLERFEGMLVRIENALANGPADQFGDVPIVAGTSRVFREPGILYPGLPGLPVFDGNPEVFDLAPNGLLLPAADIPAGASIDFAEGPLSFQFGDFALLAKSLSWTGTAEVVPVRDRNQGEWTVATQNLLRLFDTVNDPGVSDEVATPAEYADRLNKFSQHIRLALKSPDVLVVQEAEKLAVLQDLAARILSDDSTVSYTPYLLEGNDVGGIDVGFLVRSTIDVDSVTQFGAADTYTFNSATAILNDRPPLVLQGSYVSAPGAIPFPITVIGVHQRSLNGVDDAVDGPRVREKRHQQALRLSQYLQSLQTGTPNVRMVVLGDFNAFEFTDGYVDVMGQVTGSPDPLGALVPATDEVNPNLTNQTLNMPADERYSFVFDGSAQSLDHVVTSAALNSWVRGSEHSRGNADAPFTYEDDPTTSLRSSDHDGTVLFLTADSDGDGFADDVDSCDLSSPNATVIIDGCDSEAGNDLFADGCKITDFIEACAASAVTHEDFTGCVTHVTNTLKDNGSITNKEKGNIQKCAGKADIP
jgi:predicted extracellular nuclease